MMQPWSWLLLQPDLKDVENRDRVSARWQGETCLIHASKTWDKGATDWLAAHFGLETVVEWYARAVPFTRGAIIGKVEFYQCSIVNKPYSPWFMTGKVGYWRKNPVMFKTPIPYRGLPSLFFEVPDEVVAGVVPVGV